LAASAVILVPSELWRCRVGEFERQIARRAAAAVEVYDRQSGGQDRSHQRARQVLAEVRRRFVRAALYSESRLRVQYIDRPSSDRAVGYALVWAECPPRRQLCIQVDEGRAEIQWELASTDLRSSRRGTVGALHFRPEFRDQLIYALLDQASWQRSQVPSVELGAKPKPKEDEKLAEKVQERLHEKGTEFRDRLHEAADTFRENLAGGVQSAVRRGSQGAMQFGRPPSGRPPVGRQPSAYKRMSSKP
jgi:hypothetical protein